MAIPNSHICIDPMLFFNKTKGLAKGSSEAMVIEDLVVAEDLAAAEDPPNM